MEQKENQSLQLATEFEMTESQLTTIINTIAKGATISELKLFLYIAKKTGLDPFTRQIHFVKRKSKQPDGTYKESGTVQTGIDGYRAIAERTGKLGGIEDVVYDSEEQKNPKKASVTVYRMHNGEKIGFTASARWDEYCQKNFKTNEPTGLWLKMPYLMLGKCAEALALRKAFPNDLSGIYTNEEMNQSDGFDQPPAKVEVVDQPPAKKANTLVVARPPISPNLRIQAVTSKALYAEWAKFYEGTGNDPKQSSATLLATIKKEFKKESSRELTEVEALSFVERLRTANKKRTETSKAVEIETIDQVPEEQKKVDEKPLVDSNNQESQKAEEKADSPKDDLKTETSKDTIQS